MNRPELYAPRPTPDPQLGAPFPPRPQFFIRLRPPWLTRVLLVSNLVVFVAMVVYGIVVYNDLNGTQNIYVLRTFGMKVNELIAQGEVWRLFTAMFLHIGVFHLLFNLYALYALGPMVEGYFGHLRFLAIYLLGGLFGSLASYAFSPVPSAGASGAIFGLAGAITVYFLRYRENFGPRGRAILQNMLIVIAINLFFGLSVPGIDNWGHLGGLAGGALVSWGLLPRYRPPAFIVFGPQALEEEPRTWQEVAWVLFCLALLIAGLQIATSRMLAS
ncbi:rhomboid family intramembrane serine protease [Litorilinea aerophila]|nr:rhomboid family intramembrane serine protease [Litorilinea aerophila]MCC9078424.1 rhomboid family intramembrane serine protease [Litorilinea aerophila]GIV76066.1 MAG: rhomboid family intramembrane serine protease [Litorilinea sp.]